MVRGLTTVEAMGLATIPVGFFYEGVVGTSPEFTDNFITGGLAVANLARAFNKDKTPWARAFGSVGFILTSASLVGTAFGHPDIVGPSVGLGLAAYVLSFAGNVRPRTRNRTA